MRDRDLLGDHNSEKIQQLFADARDFFIENQSSSVFQKNIDGVDFAVIAVPPSTDKDELPILYAIKETEADVLGAGSFGSVTVGQTENGQCFAIKTQLVSRLFNARTKEERTLVTAALKDAGRYYGETIDNNAHYSVFSLEKRQELLKYLTEENSAYSTLLGSADPY